VNIGGLCFPSIMFLLMGFRYLVCPIVYRVGLFPTGSNRIHPLGFLILFFMMALNLKNTWRIISMLDSWKKNELVNPGFNYGTEDDYHLRFFPPGELEIIRNAQNFDVKFEDYRPRSEFSYLKEGFLNLEEMRLTDKQLMAVSLVFYGGLKKSSLDES